MLEMGKVEILGSGDEDIGLYAGRPLDMYDASSDEAVVRSWWCFGAEILIIERKNFWSGLRAWFSRRRTVEPIFTPDLNLYAGHCRLGSGVTLKSNQRMVVRQGAIVFQSFP